VVIDVGPSVATRREAAFDFFSKVINAYPDSAPVLLDLVIKNSDHQGSREAHERIRKLLLNQGMIEPNEEEKQAEQEAGAQQPTPDDMRMAAELDASEAKTEYVKAQTESELAKANKLRAETEKALADADKSTMDAEKTAVEIGQEVPEEESELAIRAKNFELTIGEEEEQEQVQQGVGPQQLPPGLPPQ